jgi:hypothetical protein
VMTLMCRITNKEGLYAARFFLGFTEVFSSGTFLCFGLETDQMIGWLFSCRNFLADTMVSSL